MVKRFFMKFYLVLIIAFLYIPIAVLVVLSFNASRSRVVWGGFTLEWYQNLLHNSDVMAALQNTLTIGFASAAIATGIGLLAAIGIDAMRKRSYTLTLGVGNIPMLNADIVTGIALMLWFSRFTNLGVRGGTRSWRKQRDSICTCHSANDLPVCNEWIFHGDDNVYG